MKKFSNSGPKADPAPATDDTPFAGSTPVIEQMTRAAPAETVSSDIRYWLEISENVAGFMNFDPKLTYVVTTTKEAEAKLSRLSFEITKAEYNKRTNSDA